MVRGHGGYRVALPRTGIADYLKFVEGTLLTLNNEIGILRRYVRRLTPD